MGTELRALRVLAWLTAFAVATLALALDLIVLDVGQGTAVVIRAPDGRAVLVDAGPASADVARQLRGLGVERLELVIASHGHSDHIGGMAAVLRELRPTWLLDNGLPHGTLTYERTLEAAAAAGVGLLSPERRTIRLGEVVIQVLPPPGEPTWGQNDNSVGVRVEYGAFAALLPGDAEPAQWSFWLSRHADLLDPVQVHLASHHGSRNGDVPAGMAALRPQLVVIAAGRDNRYGHPHAEALALYERYAEPVLRTDLHGRITVHADRDGSFTVATERTASAAPSAAPPAAPSAVPGSCIDLNRAPEDLLTEIVHVGPARASAIAGAREQRPFASVADLARIAGIGPARLSDIRAQGLACVR